MVSLYSKFLPYFQIRCTTNNTQWIISLNINISTAEEQLIHFPMTSSYLETDFICNTILQFVHVLNYESMTLLYMYCSRVVMKCYGSLAAKECHKIPVSTACFA
jgi:hypothetical protein